MLYHKGTEPTDLYHPDFDAGNRAIHSAFEPQHKVVVLTVCSWAKPYSQSWIHTNIRSALGASLEQIDYVHVSSAGIIPHQFETLYPFTAYDWNNVNMAPAMAKALQREIDERFSSFWLIFGTQWDHVVPFFRENSNTWKVLSKWAEDRRDPWPEWHPVLEEGVTEFDHRLWGEQRMHGYEDPNAVLAHWQATKRLEEKVATLLKGAEGEEE